MSGNKRFVQQKLPVSVKIAFVYINRRRERVRDNKNSSCAKTKKKNDPNVQILKKIVALSVVQKVNCKKIAIIKPMM